MFFRSSPPSTSVAPIAAAPAAALAVPPASGAAGQSRGVVLIVDDSAVIRSMVTKALESHHYVVHQAENGRLGLAAWEQLKDSVQLVVSDVFMPEMDGLTMAREIRQRSRTVPILLMSSKLDEDTRWIAEEAGFRLLPKPFKDEVLRLLVGRMIRPVQPA